VLPEDLLADAIAPLADAAGDGRVQGLTRHQQVDDGLGVRHELGGDDIGEGTRGLGTHTGIVRPMAMLSMLSGNWG
jgi:hypothetical protein